MCRRACVGLFLLVCFPAALHAQSAARPCRAPVLDGGFSVPEQDVYPHGDDLIYSCEEGRKPAVEGWWATSTCHNGSWSHEPQCIDQKACMAPVILNAKPSEDTNSWYQEGHIVWVTCRDGYEHKNRDATAKCENGKWSSVPVCEKRGDACGEPPEVPHAVVVHQEYQEVFPVDAAVQYECEEGYDVDAAQSKKTIYCMSGLWSTGPICSRRTTPDPEPSGSAASGSSGPEEKEPIRQVTTTNICGQPPVVSNGDVLQNTGMLVRYQCALFYKQVGPEAVMCFSDGTWSEVPTCKAAYCYVNTDEHPQLEPAGVKLIKDGESVQFDCVHQRKWWTAHHSVAKCVNGHLTLSQCCSGWQHLRNTCSS